MKTKYLIDHFPQPLEKELEKVEIQELMSEHEQDMLTSELGTSMFGDEYNTYGIGNAELPSVMAGQLGSEVRKWKKTINKRVLRGRTKLGRRG
jgi:hypothetical protein